MKIAVERESDLDTDEEMKGPPATSSSSNIEMNNGALPASRHKGKKDSLSTPLQQSRRNSSVHLEIRKATLMEQESLIEKVLQGGELDDDDDNDPMSALDELARQKRFQELIFAQWDVIDGEGNGDVDVKEWKKGMMRLNVSLTEEQILGLFKLLDEEEVGFVDRQTYQSFVTSNFNTDYLTGLQQPLIRLARRMHREMKEKEKGDVNEDAEQGTNNDENSSGAKPNVENREKPREPFDDHLRRGSANETGSVVVHNSAMGSTQLNINAGALGLDQLHEKSSSNLLNEKNLDTFDTFEVDGLQKEMEAELKRQASALKVSLLKEKQYLEDIEEVANSKEDFLNPEKALSWRPEEVALWLDEMGMGKYGQHIVEDGVDGNILLNDINKQVLINDIGVNSLHVGKILRAIDDLRKLNKVELETPYKDWHQLNEENKKFIKELETAQQRTEELDKQNKEMELQITQLKLNAGSGTAGLDMNEESNTATNTTEAKVANLELEIGLYKIELERLCREKITMAIQTSDEMSRLRAAVKVLQSELQRSYFDNFGNPLDSIASTLGYRKAK